MTCAQFAWRQFSLHHIRRESGDDERLDHLAEKNDDNEESYDMPVPFTTSKTSRTTSPNSKKRVRNNNNNNNKVTVATADIISPAAPSAVVKKAKTRSERRAEEPEEPEQVQEPVPRKERRSDYWVHRDDLRRGNARTMKNQFQFQFQE
jgi:hypothetical protein